MQWREQYSERLSRNRRKITPQAWIWNHTAMHGNIKEVLGCTHLFSEAVSFLTSSARTPLSFNSSWKISPNVPLTETQGLEPNVNLA